MQHPIKRYHKITYIKIYFIVIDSTQRNILLMNKTPDLSKGSLLSLFLVGMFISQIKTYQQSIRKSPHTFGTYTYLKDNVVCLAFKVT